ncbi:hypothetical protein SKAU_G00200100 [Synaphobranchus kaupii]|uniref:Fibronectin type-III domain-containing protein n=1 Tax=Synaphobranchus kaupii TaxID=118154 RepID=A0A9Q1FFD8_SYNKA|nr:hypothetical protein SKAU_G00200100 [Synaphobranchus kaupii]
MYFLIVEPFQNGAAVNHSFASLSGEVHNLQPSTPYKCYVYSSNSAGFGARSRERTVTTLVQPPGYINIEHTGRSTARATWGSVSKVLLYEVTIIDTDNPNSATFVANTSSTYLDIRNLQPCSTYRIGVSSVNAFLVSGEATYATYTTKTIGAVTSVSVDYSCSSGMVTVSWDTVFGADSYRAEATDGNGTTLSCATQSASCQITRVTCGERYLVRVTTISEDCESSSNITADFETVPCPPTGLMTYRECTSNVIVFGWEPTNNTIYYVATARDSKGEETECRTTDTSCFFTNTGCGNRYQYNVYSVNGLCNSAVSPPTHVRTAPCIPTNVRTLAECQSDVLITTWDRAAGALSYIVEAHGNRGDRYNCSSYTQSCAIPAVKCGESLSVWITAIDDDCNSGRALGQAAETVPCTPENVTAIRDCGPNTASLEWVASAGAVFYIASAVHADGTVRTCTAMDTQCQIQGLRCGQNYTGSVVATNMKCNSSESARVTLETAPCPPDHIEALLDCAANHALIVWQNHQSIGSYTAIIQDANGGLLSCSTTNNNCVISELKCGQVYAVTVQHHDGTCSSLHSAPIQMDSVPCGPENVQTNVNCGTGELTVVWDVSVPGHNYNTIVTTGNGERTVCNSTDARCSISSLDCGRSYIVMVQAINGTCRGMPSKDVVFQEAPCVPTNVTTEQTCADSTVAAVRWGASRGAKHYNATAVGNSGHRTECSSNGTACDLNDLLCGEVYTVGVVSVDENCTSLQSQTVMLQTVPCAPSSVRGWVDCTSNTASMSWDPSPNAMSYSLMAMAADGHTHSCNSTSTTCLVTGLHCGEEYDFTVTASDGSCDSLTSVPARLETAPCAPTNVDNHLYCGTNVLAVSWDSAGTPLNYSAIARAADGTAHSCSSANTSCHITDLLCGQRYSLTVTASNSNCTGPESAAQTVQTVPCAPLNVRGDQQCGTDTLLASWDGAAAASSYIAMVTGPNGYSEACDTANLSCSFGGLRCAQSYNISVLASDSACNSTAGPAVSLVTAPCDPENVATRLHCDLDAATVSWDASAGATGYTVVAQGRDGPKTCQTTGISCQLSQLACGDTYNITVLAEDGICNSTWETSAALQTAPCLPLITESSLDCATNVASLAWMAGSDVAEVVVNATCTLGHMAWCSSANGTCQLTGLQCGHTYTVVATAMGDQCVSGPSSGVDVITVPCAPAAITSRYDCGSNIAMVSWDESLGRETFQTSLEGGDHTDSCSTDQTTCSFSGLQCGHAYNVSVRALASHCNSSLSVAYGVTTVPCAPQNVSASLLCANNTALVTWDGSEGAVSYNATALGRDGDARSCSSANTSCHLPGMRCGQTYAITVTANSDTCGGFDSSAFVLTAGPCPPSNVVVALDCAGNIGLVSWDPALLAESYLATATGADGHTHTCASNSSSCSFTDLHCGETYSVTMVTIERGCTSEPSAAQDLRSAMCPPTNLEGVTSCANNTFSLSWDARPGVGVSYFLYSWQWGGANTTNHVWDTSHSVPGLQCGEHYSFRVAVRDNSCTSSLSEPLEMNTAPCPPTIESARVDCGSNRGTVFWQLSAGMGVVSYRVEAVGLHGHRASCTSNSTSCWVKLDCGRRYSATVISSTYDCNSTQDSTIEFDSAPCLPEDVMADLDCNSNVLAVQWRETPGSDSYTALAIGSDGYRTSCNSTSTACSIHDLRCGETYNITVTTSSVNCSIIQGSDYQVQSAPCPPQNPTVSLNCSSNEAAVSWAGNGTAQMHSVVAVDRLGVDVTCNSSDDNCAFSHLRCGETYTFSVVGMTNHCRSEASPPMELLTVPCAPTHVVTNYHCDTNIAMISWDPALGATMYTVWVEGNRGHSTSCNNTDTLCTLHDLVCGQDYTIIIVAIHEDCATFASESATITTGPCPHSQLQSSLDCSSNSALISWTPGNGTLTYNVSAEDLSTGDYLSCISNGSACNISDLHCGQRYRVSVAGMGLTCANRPGSWIAVNTAPCPPTQLSVHSSCDSDTMSVSWTAAVGAVTYVVTAEASDGHRRTCNSSGLTCDIAGLECGWEYAVWVTGMDDDCAGANSEIHNLRTAPCVPQALQPHLECQAGDLSVAWRRSRGALRYSVVAEGSAGDVLTCNTASATCSFPGLPCSEKYNVTVMASDDTCNSSASLASVIMTAPCPPATINATVDCSNQGNLTIEITIEIRIWIPWWLRRLFHNATAVGPLGRSYTCSTTNSSCDIHSLQCGAEYNVTVTSSMDGCAGPASALHTVRTAPCVPRLAEVEMDCRSDSASVVWASVAGASLYSVTAEDSASGGRHCGSNGTGCTVTGLNCGELYTFSLTASDGQCNSSQSNTLPSETAPCPPQDVQANMSCSNHTASVSWAQSQGALRYTATLQGMDGHTYTCTTEGNTCEVTSLPCGETYTVTVVAEGRTCNSSPSSSSSIKTAPCTPQNLTSSTSCVDGVATMVWNSSKGGVLYSVEATGSDGHSAACTSGGDSCDLTGLRCGRSYVVSVLARDATCSSAPAQPVTVSTVPCTPGNVLTEVDCGSNTMTASWLESDGAEYYTATLEDSNRHSTTCQSVGTTCNITALRCGEMYRVTVAASDSQCSSPASPVSMTNTAPCLPSNIEAYVDCQDHTATLSWFYSAGALSYTAAARTQSGHTVACHTNNTNCVVSGLACGEQHSVSVLAQGEACNSTAEMAGQLMTEPCVPVNLNVQYSLSICHLFWDYAMGATSYTAEAITDQGLSHACNTSDTNCVLRGIACGQVYNITVAAHNEACSDIATSDMFYLTTEPCPPENVQARIECESGDGLVSWEQSEVAVWYMAFLDGRNGDSANCSTANTSCTVPGLQCGTVYYVYVRAFGQVFNSTDSTSVTLTTAPCVPDTADAQVDCVAEMAMLSWSFSDGAESYTATVVAAGGHQASCTTQENHCNVTTLSCGETYNLTLNSINQQCQILTPTGVTFQTRPCTPLNVAVDLQCGTRAAVLTWQHQEGVELYTASAVTSNGSSAEGCNSTGDTCLFPNLDCGETYTFTITAHAGMCHSELSDTVVIVTEPCRPEHVTAQGNCSPGTLVLDWDEAEGALAYIVSVAGDLGYITAFNATENTLEEELPCGQTYSISVVSQDDRCESPQSDPIDFTTVPCKPQHLQSFVRCEATLGSVSWGASDGAESYMAVAVGQDSHTHMCTTNGTVCTWNDLHCGDVYTVHVLALHNICNSSPSNSTIIHTAPCVPQNLVPAFDCDLKVASLTWNASEGAELYIVAAESGDGHRLELSTNGTEAHFSEFTCGQTYSLTVAAAGRECRSAHSTPVLIQTEPCAPTAVSAEIDCISNSVVVTWTASNGSQYYTATLEAANGESQACMSSNGDVCSIPSLSCGQTYTVSVTASNQLCSSTASVASSSLITVPCAPSNLAVDLDCADNTAVVSWNRSRGALSYRVTTESRSGNLSSCASADPPCSLANLTCGTPYTVRVVAEGATCTSLPGEFVRLQTVPCAPEISMAHLDCYTNSALLEWNYAEGATSYTAVAESGSGDVTVCSTNYTNCEIRDMGCGQVYTVTMVASDSHCNSTQSAGWEITSVPCAPRNVESQLDCGTNSARVEWEGSVGAESYVVSAVGREGHVAQCNTTGLACEVVGLMCGCTYNVSVVALNEYCNVSGHSATPLKTVPCAPRQVDTNVDCDTGATTVSWEHSYGATTYTAVAQGNGGYASSCNTSGTVCQFTDLLCGMTYGFTVRASDDDCTSTESSPVYQDTILCEPQNVSAQLDCSSNVGLVMWEQGEGVASYRVRAVGPDGHRTQCNTTFTSCQLPDLHCGQRYNLTVTAQDELCDNRNSFLTLQSGPCQPRNVQTTLECSSSSASVTWEMGSGATSYTVEGEAADGHRASCNTSATYCDLVGLRCGQTYNVSVISQDDSCDSAASADMSSVQTAPCPPQNVEARVSCDSGTLVVTWQPSADADSFHVVADREDGADLSCDTSSTQCSILNLPCGHNYSVNVTAVRGACISDPSQTVRVSSAPCVPQGVMGNLDCVTNSVLVAWLPSRGAQSYTVLAQGMGGYNSSCSSTEPSCNVPDLRCGVLYTFNVTASNGYCHSQANTSFELETAPCVLSAIHAITQCHSNTIQVTWELIEGSPLFIATAEGNDHSMLSCNSTMSSCDLMGAQCGTHYTIIVAMSSDQCSSLRSPPFKINTAPCTLEELVTHADCESQGVFVSWAPSLVAESYHLTAMGRDGDLRECNTTDTNCTLEELQCGQPYSLSVIASTENCTSPASLEVTFNSVPCMPDSLSVEIECENGSAVLNWTESEGAVEFFACAQGEDGDMLYCDTTDTSCTIEGLECGALYNFSVQASDGICKGSFSQPLLEGAVPCPPDTVQTRLLPMREESQAMRVSWSRVDCPNVTYLAEATGNIQGDGQERFELSSYWTDRTFFELLLPCSSSYSVTVRARNPAGSSQPSEASTGTTAPCPPLGVTFIESNISTVLSWNASVFATEYTVYELSSTGRSEVCNTAQLSCTLVNSVNRSAIEVTASNSAGESNPARDIQVLRRNRRDLPDTEVTGLSTPEVWVTALNGSSMRVEWTSVTGATSYVLTVLEQSGTGPHSPKVLTVTSEEATVTDLKFATKYCVVVTAKNSLNTASSQPVCAVTVIQVNG